MAGAGLEIVFLSKDEISAGVDAATDFLHLIGFTDEFGDVRQMIINSQGLALAHLDGELVGVGRLIGDGIRYDYIADLNVRRKCRGQGIGKALAIKLATSSKAKFVSLTTDPNKTGLEKFYKKAGFVMSENEYVFDWLKG